MSVVSIVKVEEGQVEDAVRRAVELAGGLAARIPSGSTVLIKPNGASTASSGSGNITDARVTQAVTKLVLERDPRRVIIGEGSAVGYDFPGRMDSLHWTNIGTGSTVCTFLRVNYIDITFSDSIFRTLIYTCPAGCAFVVYYICHF